MKYFQFKALYQNNRWLSPAYVGVDTQGKISYLAEEKPQGIDNQEIVNGIAVPGFPNGHSHAFQYAMAGLAEKHSHHLADNFWTWREAMYQLALSINPAQMEAVAAMLYAEMLRNGYTHVVEFHYVHHDKDGKPYQNPAEMSERLLAAAQTAGIKITLIPIFYQKGGFGQEPNAGQKRFISKTIDDFILLIDKAYQAVQNTENTFWGNGFHSLRAIEPAEIQEIMKVFPKNQVIHLHLAEQLKEVEDCVNYLGKRPLEWLSNQVNLNDKFHLVHCTHLTDNETITLAQSGANVVLCPSTEGNLGDGFFNLKLFQQYQGSWCIGTDSHISLNPLEDLRLLDYGQRLKTHQRNSFVVENQADSGKFAISQAIFNGRKAAGIYDSNDFFEIGKSFDALVLDADYPLFSVSSLDNLISTWVYSADSSANLGTIVNGQWLVKNQQHIRKELIIKEFQKAMRELGNR